MWRLNKNIHFSSRINLVQVKLIIYYSWRWWHYWLRNTIERVIHLWEISQNLLKWSPWKIWVYLLLRALLCNCHTLGCSEHVNFSRLPGHEWWKTLFSRIHLQLLSLPSRFLWLTWDEADVLLLSHVLLFDFLGTLGLTFYKSQNRQVENGE